MNDAPISESLIRKLNVVQLVLAGILIMTPTVWMVLSSFKPSFEVTAYPPTLIFSPTIENYSQLMKTTPFFSYTINSLIVTLGSAGVVRLSPWICSMNRFVCESDSSHR